MLPGSRSEQGTESKSDKQWVKSLEAHGNHSSRQSCNEADNSESDESS